MLALSGVAAVHAEDTEGPKVEYDSVQIEGFYTGSVGKGDITITIPEGVTDPVLPIHAFTDLEKVTGFQPSDSVTYTIKLVNNSGIKYHYQDGSLNMAPAVQDLNNPFHTYYRSYNVALENLGIEKHSSQLTDAVIGAKLQEAGYGKDKTPEATAIEELDDYYVDYYNEHIADENSQVESLIEVPSSYATTLFWGKTQAYTDDVTGSKEKNSEVNRLGYRYAFDTIFTIDKAPISEHTQGKEAYTAMENRIKTMLAEKNTLTFSIKCDGETMTNAFQSTSYSFPFDFTLVQDGVTPEQKVSEPDLEKKIVGGDKINVDENGDFATVDASGKINFQLTSHVGQDLAKAIVPNEAVNPGIAPTEPPVKPYTYGEYAFTFVDYLDKELTYDASSLKVTVNGTEVTPTVTTSAVAEGQYAGRTEIRIGVDLIDAFKKGLFSYSEIGTAPVVVTYSASVKDAENVTPGKMFNTAKVVYQGGETKPDDVDADTYGLKIHKYDQTTNNGLEGAEFKLVYINEEGKEVEVATNLTSDADGNVVVKGLKAGTYRLTETKAPAGYNKSDAPLDIEVNAENDDEKYYVTTNFANVPEVHTGGAGTTMFTIGGGLLILAGAAYLIVSKKRAAE